MWHSPPGSRVVCPASSVIDTGTYLSSNLRRRSWLAQLAEEPPGSSLPSRRVPPACGQSRLSLQPCSPA
eukprot:181788-Hanusia_phi.AAC.5